MMNHYLLLIGGGLPASLLPSENKSSRLFLADGSTDLLEIEVQEDDEQRHFLQALKTPMLITAYNVIYSG